MHYLKLPRLLFLFLFFLTVNLKGQEQDRFAALESKLNELSQTMPGLNQKVELSFSGVSIQEYMRTLAAVSNLNINVDGALNVRIYNNFSNATVKDVLLLLCRKYELDITFIGSILSISAYTPPAQAKPTYVPKALKISYDKGTDQLSFDLNNDSLVLVSKEITRQSGKNIVIAPDLGNKMVSGFIQNMPFKNALEKLSFANDLKVNSTDDHSYVFEKRDREAELTTGKGGNKGNARKTGTSQADGLTFKIEPSGLLTIDAVNTPIMDVIASISSELKNNYYLFSEPKGNTTMNVAGSTYEEFLKYLLNGTDYTFRKEGNIYLIGDRNLEGLRATKVVQFKHRSADKTIDIIPADLKKGVDIKPFPDLNSLILSGSQPRIDEIEAFVRDIDRVVPVVVIEVLIVDVRDSKTVTAGIEAAIDGPKPTTGKVIGTDLTLSSTSINNIISGINGFGLVNLGRVTSGFYVKLKALESQGILKLRSTPKLATLNGHEAKMSIGKTEYYLEISNILQGSQNPITQSQQQYKSVNADLSITINPMVSGDEQITLDIKVKQSSFTERINPNAPPGNITRDFQSMIRVKNEEMVILGGLEENSNNETASGLPFLSRIPVIKWFFSSRTKANTKNKLTIFIKPTMLY